MEMNFKNIDDNKVKIIIKKILELEKDNIVMKGVSKSIVNEEKRIIMEEIDKK